MTPAEKKQAIWLGGIIGVLGMYSIYTNFFSEPSGSSSHTAALPKAAADGAFTSTAKNSPRPKGNSRARNDDFNPPYLANRIEDRPDPARIDPTLRLDYFAKVQEVDAAGGKRNLFAFGQPPPPPQAKVELPPHPEPTVDVDKIKRDSEIAQKKKEEKLAAELHTNLKYYGIVAVSAGGEKTACLLDTDEILLATEGDTLKRRYRVMKIGNTSVTVQDTESKKEEIIQIAKEATEKG